MTIEEKIKELLIENGLGPGQSDEVLQLLKDDKNNISMKGRWTTSTDHYNNPDQIIAVLWLLARAKTLKYIDEHCPQAWFRLMFTD